jgi:hypothetical protein
MRGLRMPDDLYLKIKRIAEKEERSYNQQAVYILKEFVAKYEGENGVIVVDADALYQ